MFLGEQEVLLAERPGIQPVEYFPREGQDGLLTLFRCIGALPPGISFKVQRGQLITNLHQTFQPDNGKSPELIHQFCGMVQVLRVAVPVRDPVGRGVNGFGRSEYGKHGAMMITNGSTPLIFLDILPAGIFNPRGDPVPGKVLFPDQFMDFSCYRVRV